WFTGLVAVSGVIWMLASTNFLVAAPLLACVPSVARVTARPSMVTTAVALAVKVPGVRLLIVNVQVATLPLIVGVAQVLVLEVSPAVGFTFGMIDVKTVGEAPSAMVSYATLFRSWFTGLVAVSGVIWMLASTYFLVAGPLLACVPSVARVTARPSMVTTAVA